MLDFNALNQLKRSPAQTNLQRQRAFCERNPHYYRDRHRKDKAAYEQRLAAKAAAEQQAVVETSQEKSQPAPITVLALPAPEEVTTTTVTIQLPEAFAYDPIPLTIQPAPALKQQTALPND